MRQVLLSRRWLVRHVLALFLIAGCLAMGWWQLERATSAGGNAQNVGYALQWPLFAAFVVFAWWRMLRIDVDAQAGHATPDEGGSGQGAGTAGVGPVERSAEAGEAAGAAEPPGGARAGTVAATAERVTAETATPEVGTSDNGDRKSRFPAPVVEQEPDAELEAYNAYLARLHARDMESRRR